MILAEKKLEVAMNYLKERVSYIKGLADGMELKEGTNEEKLFKAIIDVLDDIATAVDDLEEVQEQFSEQLDEMDDDLAEIESVLYEDSDEDDEDEAEDEDEEYVDAIECPNCKGTIELDEDVFNEANDRIICPSCKTEIEVEWSDECCCDSDCCHES